MELVAGYGRLGIAGGSLVGDGCPGLSYLAEGTPWAGSTRTQAGANST